MAYDLEEQEQLATLKNWWRDNGTLVIVAAAAAVIAVAGWHAWQNWQEGQARQAGTLYETLVKALQGNDPKAVRDASGTLAEAFPGSLYASMGALAAAHFHFEHGDPKNAKAQLQWVIERSNSEEMKDIARLRLAGLLIDEKAYDEALKLLEAKHAVSLAGQYAALRGDALVAKNRIDEAKAAYRLALEKAEPARGGTFRDSVQMRLDALGG